MSLFSKNLRFLRKRGSHNQDEIAILFNKRANTIGNWENQKSEPSLSELVKLGDFFGVSAGDLLQKDLENHQTAGVVPAVIDSHSARADSWHDESAGMTGETRADAFWLILRELRALHAKVDLLTADVESAGLKRNSDKSYH